MFTLETSLRYKRHPEFFVGKWGFAAPYHKKVEAEDGTIHNELAVVYGVSDSPLGLHAALLLKQARGKADPKVNPEKIVTWKQAEKYADNLSLDKRHVVTHPRFEDRTAVMDALNGYKETTEPHTELAGGRAQVWEYETKRNGLIGFVATGGSQGSYLYDPESQAWYQNQFMPMLARRSKGIFSPQYVRARHFDIDRASAMARINLTTPDDFQIENPYGPHP